MCGTRPQVDTSRCIVEGSTQVLSFALSQLKLQSGALAGVLGVALPQNWAKLPAVTRQGMAFLQTAQVAQEL